MSKLRAFSLFAIMLAEVVITPPLVIVTVLGDPSVPDPPIKIELVPTEKTKPPAPAVISEDKVTVPVEVNERAPPALIV